MLLPIDSKTSNTYRNERAAAHRSEARLRGDPSCLMELGDAGIYYPIGAASASGPGPNGASAGPSPRTSPSRGSALSGETQRGLI